MMTNFEKKVARLGGMFETAEEVAKKKMKRAMDIAVATPALVCGQLYTFVTGDMEVFENCMELEKELGLY